MKRLLIILLGLALISQANAMQKPITFVYEVKAHPPYHLGEGIHINWEKPGITLELLKLVATQLKLDIRFVRVPWARGIFMVEHNSADGIFHASFNLERGEFGAFPMKNGELDPSRRLMSQSYFLYKLKSSPLNWDGKQLSPDNPTVGAVIGYAVIKDLTNMGVNVLQVSSQMSGLEMLLRHRFDGWADLGNMTDFKLHEHPENFKDIVKMSPALVSRPYYLMLSRQFVKQNPKLAEMIWDQIKIIRESIQYKNIVAKYSEK